jgi:uncharacterized protein (TIGR02117 family)
MRAAVALLLLSLVGCVIEATPPAATTVTGATAIVHVISNGWHTGLVLARRDIPIGVLPEINDFPLATYLEFGWGDRAYYPHPDPGIGLALAALLTPTAAVMHIAGHGSMPHAEGRSFAVVAIPMTTSQLRRLVSSIDASFDRPAGERARAVAAGLYPDSLFYPAVGTFHLYETCNTWTARRLAAAGLDVPTRVTRARPLMGALEAYATRRNQTVTADGNDDD